MRTQVSTWNKVKDRGVVWLIVAALVAVVVWFYWPPQAASSIPNLPQQYKVSERTFNLGHTFDVESNDTTYGTVDVKWFRLTTTIFYRDNEGKLVAYGKKAAISIGTRINIYDGNGNLIGTLQKNIFSSLLGPVTSTYSVLDAQGNEIASSVKFSVITTSIKLNDKNGHTVVELSRPLSVLSDTWDVTVHKPGVIDSRIVVMIGAFKTAAN